MKQHQRIKKFKFVGACILILLLGAGITGYICLTGLYPRGYDTMYYIYRGQSLYESIQAGNLFPSYDQYLYNGVQPLAQWAPLSTYLLAIFCFINDNVLDAYLVYVGTIFCIGAFGWLMFGKRKGRTGLSVFMGVIWFFLPDNMQILFGSGNLPRSLVAALLSWFFFFIYAVLEQEEKEQRKWCQLIGLAVTTALLILSSFSQALVVLMATVLFLIVYGMMNRCIKRTGWVAGGMMSGLLFTGVWTFSLVIRGDITLVESGSSLADSFQSILETLNPVAHLENFDLIYVGIIYLILSVGGLLLSNRKSGAGFATGLFVIFSTSLSAYTVYSNLPFSEFMVASHFLTIGFFLILLSLLYWKRLKKWILIVCSVALVIDCIPSVGKYLYATEDTWVADAWDTIDQHAASLSLDRAKDVTTQRIALLELSTYVAFAPYYLAGRSNKTLCTFGAAWQSAFTAENIVRLNTAYTQGYYEYLFDRCKELGNDTVFLRSDLLENGTDDLEKVVEIADKAGYSFIWKDDVNCIFHMDTPETFGVLTEYEGIAIGDAANEMALRYPTLKETEDSNLNHYTVEELSQYQKIYLSDFTYDDQEAAEELLYELVDAGCDIYIDMNKIPQNDISKFANFMGVSVMTISLEDSYPDLVYEGQTYQANSFPATEESWNTVFLSNVENETGVSDFEGSELTFAGTDSSGKIHYIAFNIPYYVISTGDSTMGTLLDEMLDMTAGDTPERTLVPISVTYENDEIIIESDYDDVNTTLAYLDNFESEQELTEDNNLLFVKKGTTVIHFSNPYLKEGIAISIGGVILLLFLLGAYKKHIIFTKHTTKQQKKTV